MACDPEIKKVWQEHIAVWCASVEVLLAFRLIFLRAAERSQQVRWYFTPHLMLGPNNPGGGVDVIYACEIGMQLSDRSWLTLINKRKKKKKKKKLCSPAPRSFSVKQNRVSCVGQMCIKSSGLFQKPQWGYMKEHQ